MKTMQAKYAGKCANSGASFRKGDTIVYDPQTRRAFLPETIQQPAVKPNPQDHDQAGDMMQAILDQQSDNFCYHNNI